MFHAVFVSVLIIGAMTPCVRAQSNVSRVAGKQENGRILESIRTTDEPAGTTIRHKLATIVIPSIEFHATTIPDAIEWVRQEARRLDPDPDPHERGVNIFLKLSAVGHAATVTKSTTPMNESNNPGSSLGSLFDPPVPSVGINETRITLTLNHIPLGEALKYIASQAGLKVRVEAYAISLVPITENTDTLITAVFRVPPNMIGNVTGGNGKTALEQPVTSAQ